MYSLILLLCNTLTIRYPTIVILFYNFYIECVLHKEKCKMALCVFEAKKKRMKLVRVILTKALSFCFFSLGMKTSAVKVFSLKFLLYSSSRQAPPGDFENFFLLWKHKRSFSYLLEYSTTWKYYYEKSKCDSISRWRSFLHLRQASVLCVPSG